MALILDFVVNQTSWDHPWITQHPDWYVRINGVIQPLNPFPDVAALDFNNQNMRAAIVDAMRYWIFAANIDGYRCDYANNAPLDFWTNTISNLRGITSHKLLMFAEGDRQANFQTGFDLNFGDKWYYDAIRRIAQEGLSVSQIQTTTNTEYSLANSTQQVVRYTANHDTEDQISPISVFSNHNGVVANFIVSAYMRGVPFLTSGQEVAFNQTIPWPYTSVKINWSANPGAAADFSKILNFRISSNAIRRGTMTNYSDNNVCAFTKISGNEKVVVLVNLRNASSNYVIPAALAGNYIDAYTQTPVTLISGATQTLTNFQYRVLTNGNVPPVAVTGVSVSPNSASITTGTTRQLTATISPANATNQNVSWTSSNPSVATVSASGLVTAIGTGSATITVATQDGNKTATSAITVTPSTSFSVNFYKPTNWGTGIRIYWWAAQPSGILADGTWPGVLMTNSGNGWYSYTFTNVASTNLIFNDGSNQTADLNRSKNGWYMNGTWHDSNPGSPIAVTGVSVTPTSSTVNVNATIQLTATVTPANATNKNVTWSSSNTSVATVNTTGLVTAVGGGSATITVTTQDGNRTATSSINVPSPGITYYQIINRWQNTYLYDGGNGQVRYGATPSATSYQWQRVDAGDGFFILKNRATGNIIHVENQNGSVQCTAGNTAWWSAMWSLPSTGDGWIYVINRWQTSQRIHVENLLGYAQYSGAQTGWHSAMWQLVNPQTAAAGGRLAFDEPETIQTEEGIHVDLYPNPSTRGEFEISIRGTKDQAVSLLIRNIQGQAMIRRNVSFYDRVAHDLAPGMYFLEVIVNGTKVSKKLIVE
jgi:uncharacterized protein YjdB